MIGESVGMTIPSMSHHNIRYRSLWKFMEKIRLSKLMSQQGLCSRGKRIAISNAGGYLWMASAITELGTKIYPAQKISFDKRAQAQQLEHVTILLNKPIGYVSGQPEPGYQPAVSLINHGIRFEGDQHQNASVPCI